MDYEELEAKVWHLEAQSKKQLEVIEQIEQLANKRAVQLAHKDKVIEVLATELSLDDNNQALVLDGVWTRAQDYSDWIKWAEAEAEAKEAE